MDEQQRKETRFIISRLGAMIREQEGEAFFARVERLCALSKAVRAHHRRAHIAAKRRLIARLTAEDAYRVAHALSLFFLMVNLCEERARVRHLQSRAVPAQSLRALFRELKHRGVTEQALQACLDTLEIEPVLTAHPTEAKRRTIINHMLQLASRFDDPDEILETLWHTDEIREHRITPLDEVDNTLYFFARTIVPTVAAFYAAFDAELRVVYPNVKRRRCFLTFASWVGGDRDGHPLVTPEVSIAAADRQRESIMAHYARRCDDLIGELTHSVPGAPAHETIPTPFPPAEKHRRRLYEWKQKLARDQGESAPFIHDLETIQSELREQGARRAASGGLAELRVQAETFGFHLAELDFRDHSGKLKSAPDEVLQTLQALRGIQQRHGEQAARRFILSMTRDAEDMLALLALARRANARIDIVPLFETIGDLERAPEIMTAAWGSPAYREHLRQRGNVQEIMLGYSDSNKDGGYLAANWFLYLAQERLVKAAQGAGVHLRFFHGKGGSIDRGGGMSHRSLRAQPHASHGGRIRITEQGEVVALKYSNPHIAQRNLEQLTSAVIATHLLPPSAVQTTWLASMEEMASRAMHHYQDLVYRTPAFARYYREATPIDLIERLSIGSRPSRKSGDGDVRQLRAIPWVFAWIQSRHMISAWYGLGAALEGHGRLPLLRTMYKHWPFFRMLLDNAEVSLAKTDMYIAGRYASLVQDAAVRHAVFSRIHQEYERSVRMVLQVCEHNRLLEDQPVLAESIRLRNPYVDPLNYLQVQFLRRWRKNPSEELRRVLALTVNGIAHGMKSTG